MMNFSFPLAKTGGYLQGTPPGFEAGLFFYKNLRTLIMNFPAESGLKIITP